MSRTMGIAAVLSTYLNYQLVTRDMERSIGNVAKEPMVARETAYYLENIVNVKSVKEFVADDRLFNYAMKAHGLEDMAYAKAFMVKVLNEGIDDSDAFANKLTDKRYAEFAKTFDFKGQGEVATLFTRAQQGTVDQYMRQTLEQNTGEQNEGVRLALYFERKIGDIDNAYEILADKALSSVVRTALGIPDSLATADIDKQAAMIEDKIDFDELKEPEGLAKFMQRYTAMYELKNPTSSAATSISVLFTQPAEYGISTNLLLSMQSLKF